MGAGSFGGDLEIAPEVGVSWEPEGVGELITLAGAGLTVDGVMSMGPSVLTEY